MTVRIATAQDKEKVLSLLDEFAAFLKAADVPSQVGRTVFDEVMKRDDIKIFVAEDEKEMVGYLMFFLLPIIRHGVHYGHIEELFVSEKSRGNGVGRALFNAAKEYCLKNKVKVIKLASGNELTKAHEFYERNGGKSTERFFR